MSNRMMIELRPVVQVAIRIRAAKDGIKTGQVVEKAIRMVFPDDVESAKREMARAEEKGRGA